MKRLAAFLLLLLFIFPLSADSTLDFVHVGIDITVSESKTYTVVENLTIDYREPHHGFIRDIPLDGASLEIIDVSGDYSVQTSGGITSIVIGNADETVQGVKDYTLSYRIDPGFDRFPGYDEFCIDLFSAYDQSVNNIQFSVAFPSQIDQDKVWVTYGPYGSTRLLDFQFTDGRIITGTLDELGDGETITIEAEMADGYFIRSDYSLPAFIVSLVISLALIGLYVFLYIRFGRDEEPVVSVRFSPPDNLSPLDIGYLFDSNDDTRDYTAMIYYWADQGLLSIEEKDEDEFILHKKKDIDGDREAYEVNLFNALFKSGSDADLSGLNIFQDIQSSVRPLLKAKYSKGEKALSDAKSQRFHNICFALTFVYCLAMAFSVAVNDRSFGLFAFILIAFQFVFTSLVFWSLGRRIPGVKTYVFSYMIIAIVTLFSLFILQAIATSAGISTAFTRIMAIVVAISVSVLSGLCSAMTKRSAYAQEVLGQILGYRDFLENVEIDKLRTLIDENPSYFYHNLSYAIVLDLEKEWADKASDLVKEPAVWYTGYGNPVLSSYFYYSMFNRINNRYRSCFAPPASAYRSSGRGPGHPGFSSFAGGGSGGGGARGW